MLCCYTVIIKAYRFKYNWFFSKNLIISLKIAQLLVYHKSYLIEKQSIKYGNIPLVVHFN